MSLGALASLPGDPAALARAASRLGQVAAEVGDHRAGFRRGAGLVAVSVMHSDSAFRLTELHRGVQGVEAELATVEDSGTAVAQALEQHAADWGRVEEQLEDWRSEVARAERAAEAAGPPGSSPEADTAHQRARTTRTQAEADAVQAKQRLMVAREVMAGIINAHTWTLEPTWAEISPDSIRGASMISRGSIGDPWGQLARAWDHIAAEETRKEKAQLGHQVWGGIVGFTQGAEDTVIGLWDIAAHPIATAQGLWDLEKSMVLHPIDTTRALVDQFTDPYQRDWATDERGHAIGTGAWLGFELAFGAKGLTKAGSVAHGVKDAAAAARAARAAKLADLRIARERHGHLTSNAVQVGVTSYLFRDEHEACWALHHPLPYKTYRVEYETLPTDYHLDQWGRIEVIRGPKTLRRASIPVVPDKAYDMSNRLAANGWHKIQGYAGNKNFKNKPGPERDTARLPEYTADGEKIKYREYDIDPLPEEDDVYRNSERIVRGGGRVWYTDDHYKTFVEVR